MSNGIYFQRFYNYRVLNLMKHKWCKNFYKIQCIYCYHSLSKADFFSKYFRGFFLSKSCGFLPEWGSTPDPPPSSWATLSRPPTRTHSLLCHLFIQRKICFLFYLFIGRYTTGYAGCEQKKQKTRRELLREGRTLFISGMCGYVLGLLYAETAESLRNPETRRIPSYVNQKLY